MTEYIGAFSPDFSFVLEHDIPVVLNQPEEVDDGVATLSFSFAGMNGRLQIENGGAAHDNSAPALKVWSAKQRARLTVSTWPIQFRFRMDSGTAGQMALYTRNAALLAALPLVGQQPEYSLVRDSDGLSFTRLRAPDGRHPELVAMERRMRFNAEVREKMLLDEIARLQGLGKQVRGARG